MSEHALHFVIRHGVWGVAGVQFPPMVFAFFWGGGGGGGGGLSAQSRTVMMIITLYTPLW